ncbi:hypothetical protein CS063_01615 [Sporanaerobium hydrogeniformans]|uniref:Uncharacterized protein n=1 Tax=Sporanaerobium hydrogeniformans TaxID=3072179 RepID=A0AC61DGU6_9FIRM|nr:hypothetical protein [Sporanaerobium hydrogeniformans]PHV72198.1 hypothetical protein CS063_01615 [Sporanaerobium hydrogeniformans]
MNTKGQKPSNKLDNDTKHKICTNCIQYQVSDKPNKIANLGFRVIYTFVSWLWLGYGVTDGNAFFVSLGLFIVPLLIDYLSFIPQENTRKWMKVFEISICIGVLIFAYIGISGSINIINDGNNLVMIPTSNHLAFKGTNFKINISIVYYLLLIFVLCTGIDWIATPRTCENKYRESLKPSVERG